MTPFLSLRQVSKHYSKDNICAVDQVSLSVEKGEFLAVLGPSGSGKSTLLHLMGGIEFPDSGTVEVNGHQPRDTGQWSRVRAGMIGYVFQAFHLLPTLTAAENVEIPMFGIVKQSRERHRKALVLLDRVGLSSRASHKPSELSGGECQRVAIARSLANAPSLLLADEPTGNLDTRTSSEILALFDDIRRQGNTTLVMVTHEPDIACRATRIIRYVDGRIAAEEKGHGDD